MKRSRFLLIYFASWLPLAVGYSTLIYFSGRDRQLAGAIQGGFQSIITASLLGLVAWQLSARLAERARPLLLVVAAHVGLAVAYSAIWTGIILGSIAAFAPKDVLTVFIEYALGWNFLTGLFFYGVVAGIAHAVTVGRRLRREREATIKAESLRTKAELSALRAQMNPHFLFNTLNSIAALVRSDPKVAEDALERLATLLRRLLDTTRTGADQVPLAEEWEIVRDQLELEKLRFGDRLIVETDIESDALDCVIPVFTLQPLVENAIRHGVAARTVPCTVRISAKVKGETLALAVGDDGPGADVKSALKAPGLGLRSISQRLMAMFGDRAGVHVQSDRGFLVTVTLPAIESAVPSREYRAVAT